jgi:acyl-coenzyme A synthetase/AMP-(fatty) acid ligase
VLLFFLQIFCPLLQGQQIIILGKMITSNPNIFIQKMQIYQVTRLVLVPSLLKAMFQTMKIIGVDEGRKMLQSIKLWVCSGETLSKDLLMGNLRLSIKLTVKNFITQFLVISCRIFRSLSTG